MSGVSGRVTCGGVVGGAGTGLAPRPFQTDPVEPTAGLALARAIDRQRAARREVDGRLVAQGLRDVFLDLGWTRAHRCVALYRSTWPEPGTDLLRSALAARGVVVLLPRRSAAGPLVWTTDLSFLSGTGSRPGLRRKHSSRWQPSLPDADLVLVPALAVDTLGFRLSHPDDGYLAALSGLAPQTPVIGVVHDEEILDAALGPLPSERDGLRVTGVLTPTRFLPLALSLTAG
jgi:5-formyltetrahydrofolate cyclo-ligase